jgi:hypothetical protein
VPSRRSSKPAQHGPDRRRQDFRLDDRGGHPHPHRRDRSWTRSESATEHDHDPHRSGCRNRGATDEDRQDVLKTIKDNDVKYVDLRFTDPRGKWQHVTFDLSMVDEDLFDDGTMFDGSSIAGWKAINESDMTLMPDPTTAVIDPFFAQPTLVHRLRRARADRPAQPYYARPARRSPRRPRPT